MEQFKIVFTFLVVFCLTCIGCFMLGAGDDPGVSVIAMGVAGFVVWKIWG